MEVKKGSPKLWITDYYAIVVNRLCSQNML